MVRPQLIVCSGGIVVTSFDGNNLTLDNISSPTTLLLELSMITLNIKSLIQSFKLDCNRRTSSNPLKH
jgi:hypothetical protein